MTKKKTPPKVKKKKEVLGTLMELYVLGTTIRDNITNTEGILTHIQIDMSGQIQYIYQPGALNPETGKPVDCLWLENARIENGVKQELLVPMHYMGTIAVDKATKFTGKVVSLIYHLNNCLHVEIKPEGLSLKNGSSYSPAEFDIRRLEGEAITPLTGKKLKESLVKTPSPIGMESRYSR